MSETSVTMCTVDESRGSPNESDHLVVVDHGDSSEQRDKMREDIFDDRYFGRLPVNEAAEELLALAKIACPIILTSLLLFSRSIVTTFFMGHFGQSELAGSSLGMGFGNVSGISLMKGLSVGMEPICCQAYGAKKMSVISQTYVKTIFLLFLVCIPIILLWLNIEPIFLLLGQDPGVTKIAKVYMVFSIPDLLGQANLFPLRIFLRTQGVTTPLTIVAICATILHLPIIYFLAVYLKLGTKGVALASGWYTININLGLLGYLLLSKTPLKPWNGPTILTLFQGWRPLLALALPSACSVCLEWWWYEIMLFLCGLLSNPEASLAAMGIIIQTTGLLYVFPYSLGLGLTTRIGHRLGAGQPFRAQLTSIVGLVVAVAWGFSAFALMVAVKSVWGKLFTSESQVLVLLSAALPIVGLCEIGNSPQTAACGVLTGSARPTVGARVNFITFYLIGLPVAVLMGFKFKIGFQGLLFGLVAAQGSCMCMMVYTLMQTDWKHQTKRAEELTRAAGETDDLEATLLE
ncbi:hypothetical protein AAG906_037274 [Vitis piasezkii]